MNRALSQGLAQRDIAAPPLGAGEGTFEHETTKPAPKGGAAARFVPTMHERKMRITRWPMRSSPCRAAMAHSMSWLKR